METLGKLTDRLQRLIDDTSTEAEADIHSYLNDSYLAHVEKANFNQFVEQVTLSGAVLPADLVRPVFIEDDTEYLYFNIHGQPERYLSSRLYNWWINQTVTTPLLTGTDLAVTENSTTITSATGGFDSTWAGEYVRIGENSGVYKIDSVTDTNNIELKHAYRGATASAQYFEIRPEGTLNMALTDDNGDTISTTTAKLWYIRKPLPLYNDYDKCLLPGNCDAVMIDALRMLLETQKYVTDSQRKVEDYDMAWARMKSQGLQWTRPRAPRDRHGNRIRYGHVRVNRNNVRSDGRIYLRY